MTYGATLADILLDRIDILARLSGYKRARVQEEIVRLADDEAFRWFPVRDEFDEC